MREEVGLSGGEEEAGVEAAVGDEVDGVRVLDADGSGHERSPELRVCQPMAQLAETFSTRLGRVLRLKETFL